MKRSLRHAAKALIVSSENPHQIALIRERLADDTLIYDLPGGGIEPTETPVEAAQREVKEELGIEIVVGALCGTYEYDVVGTSEHTLCQVYFAHYDQTQPIDTTNNPPDERILGMEWFDIHTLVSKKPESIEPDLWNLLKTLSAEFRKK